MSVPEVQSINHALTLQPPFPDLYRRLEQAGFDEKFVRRYILPTWWKDELESIPETRTMAEAAIARMLGIPLQSLRSPGAPLSPVLNGDYGLTDGKDSQIHGMLPAIALAQTVANMLTGVMPELPALQPNHTAATVRQSILEKRHSVDLQGLLDWAWQHGIVVALLRKVPQKSKRFSGIAMYSNTHPVILLGSSHDAPPWLAYHLAYELGHVLEGRMQRGHPVVDSDIDISTQLDGLANSAVHDNDEDERAKLFALFLLTGRSDLQFKLHQDLTADQFAARAKETEQSTRINAGMLALIYGRSAHQMKVTQDVLKALELDQGGQQMIAIGVQQHLPDELPAAAVAIMPLIGCV